ncbi:hypothetical protein AgCh_013415 [Apium graveolens]
MGILKQNPLEVQGIKLEEAANQKPTSLYYPQSFQKHVDSDNEEPEMDSEDEPEMDPEEEPEEDPEEEDPEEVPEEEPDEDPSAECVFGPDLKSDVDKVNQNLSDGKQRIVVSAAVRPSLPQNFCLEKNCEHDEASKQEFKNNYAAVDQHCVPGELEGAVVRNENSVKEANPGKKRCGKWDQDPEDNQKAVIEDRKRKKGKTMGDAVDSNSTLQEPLHLIDLRSNLSGPLLDLEVQSLKKRFSEISSILDALVDGKLKIGVHAPEKLIKEREKIFSELAKRNAIISRELYVPVKEYPTYNFISLILGPKGNTQKRMELKSGARIRLRGKDSSKSAQEADSSEDEELNVYIEAIGQKSLDAAVCMVEKLLIPAEEGVNDVRQAQPQELSSLNAEAINNSCSVCKGTGHNQLACPQKETTLKAAFETCGSFSHPTSGCPVTPSNMKIISSREIDAANLYVGCLPQTIDDSRLWELFSPFGTITQLKVRLDMTTGYSKGYGLVRFDTPAAASLAIMHMNGYQIDGHRLIVRIAGTPPVTGQQAISLHPVYSNPAPALAAATNYPTSPYFVMPETQLFSLNGEGLSYPSSMDTEYLTNLYIGFLPQSVDDNRLWELFSPFGTITRLKVALDRTGYSKGYGFVRFDTHSAASSAIMHMHGYEIDGHRLTVKIAETPPVRGQPATNLLHVCPNPGPTALATSYPSSPYDMMRKAQAPALYGSGIGFPSSFSIESGNQFSQTEAPVIPQELLSWSTGPTTAISSTDFVSSLTESKSELTSGSASGSTESIAVFSSAVSVSVSVDSSSASLATVSTSGSALSDCVIPEALVPILNCEGFGYPSSLNMADLTNIFVGFLPRTIDDGCLRELFSPFGTVTQSRVILDMVTGYSKGYGFVRFDSPSAADLAIVHMNGYQIDGHRLAVRRKTTGTPSSSFPALPRYMMPKAQVSSLHGEAIGFNQFSQTEASTIPQGVSGSSGSITALSSSSFVSRSAQSGTTFCSNGLISGSTESRITLTSTGSVATSAESKSVISSYSFTSLFCGDSNNPKSGN